MLRKLASVRKIVDLQPIKKADLIELAQVDGWRSVVKKGEFSVGDTVIYCEIDSFLPIKEEFEFLRKTCYKKLPDGQEGFRLKTIRLRGQISQGLILPMSVLPEGDYKTGDDVTHLLGITKFEPPIPQEMIDSVIGAFPSFIKKTEEERIQNMENDIEELQNRTYYVTEKLDGTSMTSFLKSGEFGVCGRNYQYKRDIKNPLWAIATKLSLEEKMKDLGRNIAIQGELVGPGVSNGNPYKLEESEFYVYNVFDIDNYGYLSKEECKSLTESLGLKLVPVVSINAFLPDRIDEILQLSEGPSQLNSNVKKEGDVWVSGEGDDRISFKVISNAFLLEEK